MNIKTRVEKLEQLLNSDGDVSCVIVTDNLFGTGTEEEQLDRWKRNNPGVEPNILRIELVSC